MIEDAVVKERLPMVPMRGESMDKIKNHAKLMAEMIPPLSSAAGGMSLQKIYERNKHMTINMNEDGFKNATLWPTERPKKSRDQQDEKRWLHGDYKDAPFLLTWSFIDR